MRDPGGSQPPSLHAGDRIAVISPSGPADPARLERGSTVLRDLGFDVVIGEHALDHASEGPGPASDPRSPAATVLDHLAGADADRASDLQRAWCDPGIA